MLARAGSDVDRATWGVMGLLVIESADAGEAPSLCGELLLRLRNGRGVGCGGGRGHGTESEPSALLFTEDFRPVLIALRVSG